METIFFESRMLRDQKHLRPPGPPLSKPPVSPTPPKVSERSLAALAERYGVPAIDVAQLRFPFTNLDLLPQEIAKRHLVIPVIVREDAICLAMAEPSEHRVIEELEFVSGRRVFPYA